MNLKKIFRHVMLVLFLNSSSTSFAIAQMTGNPDVIYVSPAAGSYLNHPRTSILVKYRNMIDEGFFKSNANISIRCGAQVISIHSILVDGYTILVKPDEILMPNKLVNVNISGIPFKNGSISSPFSYEFLTTGTIGVNMVNTEPMPATVPARNVVASTIASSVTGVTDTFDFLKKQIPITVTANNHTSTGYYFISTLQYNVTIPNRCMIIDNTGKIVFDRLATYYTLDFKKLSDSLYSYFNWADSTYRVLDDHFNEIDLVKAGNGYITDNHELQFDKRTGHYLLLAQQYVTLNMADSIQGGNSNARVLGLIIQELDKNKNVVFEWKTLDHLPITATVGQSLTAAAIDYAHCNAIDIESDTTLLLSSRHLCEIERIDRRTGAVIWRFGLHAKYNEFTFSDDTIGFTYQHDARRLPNGHITLFDDGNLRSGPVPYSRAVEYELDEINMKAHLVWEYNDNKEIYAAFMGNVQRLSNGNTLIGWGGSNTVFTEVDSLNQKVFEINMPQAYSYRAFRFDIQKIVNQNSVTLNQPEALSFCNNDSSLVLNNILSYFTNSTPTGLQYMINRTNDSIFIATKTTNDFMNYSSAFIKFNYNQLALKDTFFCQPSSLTLATIGNCTNAKFLWSTNDTNSSIHISPTSTTTYWVQISNGNFVRTDSVAVRIESIPDYTITGNKQFSDPNSILTFSVLYNPKYNYLWGTDFGSIQSRIDTNVIEVLPGQNQALNLTSYISNSSGCSNSNSISIVFAGSTGIQQVASAGNEVSIYPNPANDLIFIHTNESYIYSISDMNGKGLLKGISLNPNAGISTSQLSAGLYILTINTGGNNKQLKFQKL